MSIDVPPARQPEIAQTQVDRFGAVAIIDQFDDQYRQVKVTNPLGIRNPASGPLTVT